MTNPIYTPSPPGPFYIIRRKSDCAHMPASRGGQTWVNPSTRRPPRLFSRLQDARLALSLWAKGRVKTERRFVEDDWDGHSFLYHEPDSARRLSDFEIIEVTFGTLAIHPPTKKAPAQ